MTVCLIGAFARLDPLRIEDAPALAHAGRQRGTYGWTWVPDGEEDALAYAGAALAGQATGREIPFVVRDPDGVVVGSTRFLGIERWGGDGPTSVEVGATWYAEHAQATRVNPQAKLLLLTHAFERWSVSRVQLKTDARNTRSRRAIERLGARFEGVLRSFQPGQGELGAGSVRDTAMYSLLPDEWPRTRAGLEARLGLDAHVAR